MKGCRPKYAGAVVSRASTVEAGTASAPAPYPATIRIKALLSTNYLPIKPTPRDKEIPYSAIGPTFQTTFPQKRGTFTQDICEEKYILLHCHNNVAYDMR
jgi:hypothetical protein